ncbi:hypothetical protein NQ317_013115 [Molorchus minor]|uniref:Uncharacterized protein n=1 Tax=Molorchus minor TaxID=1323400 RepID=A0ABQ9JWR8_9CUCU|nr:hypothetical protein NQ317_013115 [Molorchus minor]
MLPASVIRRLFPRSLFIHSRSGQSVERFVLIDGSEAEPYILPNTECSYCGIQKGYWRPTSLPTENSTDPSISYINSHC